MIRLPAPYGDCVKEGKNADFIYLDKQYSAEGCQRSCIQKHLALKCGCGDPRFPPYQDKKNCPVDDPEKSKNPPYCNRSLQEPVSKRSWSTPPNIT